MVARRANSLDLAIPAEGRAIFSKKVAIQRALNRGELAFLDLIHGLPADVALERIRRAFELAEKSFSNFFGPDKDEEVLCDFMPTAYDIAAAHPSDNDIAVSKMTDYLRIATESAQTLWPGGAPKKPFPFSPRYAVAPTLASLAMKLVASAEIYDLRLGRDVFVKSITTLVMKMSVGLARRMIPEASQYELASLTQSMIKRVGDIAIEAWREVSSEMVATLQLLPEAERPRAAAIFKPLSKLEISMHRRLSDLPDFIVAMHATLEEELSRVFSEDETIRSNSNETPSTSPGL